MKCTKKFLKIKNNFESWNIKVVKVNPIILILRLLMKQQQVKESAKEIYDKNKSKSKKEKYIQITEEVENTSFLGGKTKRD